MPLRALITVIFSALVQLSMAQQRFPPSPYDGEDGLKSLIERELVYPRKALRDSTEGVVNLLFVVDRDGSIKGLKVWQSLSAETDAEAIRVLNKVQWILHTWVISSWPANTICAWNSACANTERRL